MKQLKIGNILLKNPLILAPMLDITNLPYRLICRKAGASLAFTEMIYTSAISHENKKTLNMMKTSKKDSPLGIQITANNPDEIKQILPNLNSDNFDLIDINCGCPSDRIIGNQAGAYLLNNPEKITKMIKILKTSNLPITVKIRLGFKKNNVIKIAKIIEKAGAEAITVHARLATQGYDIPADYTQLKKTKSAIGIPLIGNGDIFSEEKAQEILDICDGAMIARGAIGDPLIFNRILYYLKTGKKKEFNFKKNIKSFQDYLNLSEKYNIANLSQIKYIGSKLIRNIPKASNFRDKLMHLSSIDEIKNFVKTIN
ncbi:MAG: tRNA-dihydrouridine synthase family protein [archaeon]|nr:tRNA-dihydrouridine synthase family protein [archaeon]